MPMISTLLVVVALLGQETPQEGAPPGPEVFRLLTIHAQQEGRGQKVFDPTLSSLEEYLEKLPYDTFRETGFHELEAPYGADASVDLGHGYTFHGTPKAQTESGEVLFDARIELAEGESSLRALEVAGRAARGHGVVFRGLALPQGELIVVMSVAKAEEKGGGAGQGQQQSDQGGEGSDHGQEGDGGEGSGQEDQTGEEEPAADPQDAAPDVDEQPDASSDEERRNANETPVPPDLANVEAILRSLEEQDMREQKNARSRRFEVTVQGDWW
jgi:hypothetical protein